MGDIERVYSREQEEQLARKLEEKERELDRREKRLQRKTILLLFLLILLLAGIGACYYQYSRGELERPKQSWASCPA